MVGHQAVSQQSHVIAHHRLREDALECRIILVCLEDSQPGVGPIQGVNDTQGDPPDDQYSAKQWVFKRAHDQLRSVRRKPEPSFHKRV